jgi:rhodanese-related sulfurtransferase
MFNLFKKIVSISPEDAVEKINGNNICLIDVRSAEEFRGGHAKGAQNIPLETLMDNCGVLKRYDEVYIICQSGGRSAQATEQLSPLGVNAINVSGGTSAWKLAGLSME